MQSNFANAALDSALLAEVRRLELRTRRSISADMLGNYRSAFRGSGLVFSDLREYEPGDDVKAIHWKATARSQKVFVKSYHEDRSVRIMLCVDTSASTLYGSRKTLHRKAFEFAAAISLLAQQSGDSTGLLLFSNQVETMIPPRAGKRAMEHLLATLLAPRELQQGSDLEGALRYLNERERRRSVVFVVSDFHTPPFEEQLRRLSFDREVVLAYLAPDPLSRVPRSGLIRFRDPESGQEVTIDSSSTSVRKALQKKWEERWKSLEELARRCECDLISVGDRVLSSLVELMRRRRNQRGAERAHIVRTSEHIL